MQSIISSFDWPKHVNFHTDGAKAAKNAVEDLNYLSQHTALRGNVGAGADLAPMILLAGGLAKLANAGLGLASLANTSGLVSFQFNNLSLTKAAVLIDFDTPSGTATLVQRTPAPIPPGESDVLAWSKPSAFVTGDSISFRFCVGEIVVGVKFEPYILNLWPNLVLSCGPNGEASHTWPGKPCLSGFTYKGSKKDRGSAFSVYISPLWTEYASEMTVTIIDADPEG